MTRADKNKILVESGKKAQAAATGKFNRRLYGKQWKQVEQSDVADVVGRILDIIDEEMNTNFCHQYTPLVGANVQSEIQIECQGCGNRGDKRSEPFNFGVGIQLDKETCANQGLMSTLNQYLKHNLTPSTHIIDEYKCDTCEGIQHIPKKNRSNTKHCSA